MNKRNRKIAGILKKRFSEEVQLLNLKVFGSRAKGDADEYSDMDVFVEVESISRKIRDKINDIAWEVGYENFIVISPIIFTRDEIKNSPLRSSPIVKSILEEGIGI